MVDPLVAAVLTVCMVVLLRIVGPVPLWAAHPALRTRHTAAGVARFSRRCCRVAGTPSDDTASGVGGVVSARPRRQQPGRPITAALLPTGDLSRRPLPPNRQRSAICT